MMVRYPSIAARFLALLASRPGRAADRVLSEALAPAMASMIPSHYQLLVRLDRQSREIAVHRRPLRQLLMRAFQELVVEHRREACPSICSADFWCHSAWPDWWCSGCRPLGLGLE